MERKSNWSEFKMVLDAHNIKKLYHFTDFENLKSIISNGGLFSWKDCDDKGICIPKPGGSPLSRELDGRDGLERYVRLSFTTQHPMMYEAKKDGRLSNPVVLEIDPEVVFWKSTLYSDRNATKNGAQKGDTLDDFKSIHFDSVKALNHFDLDEDEQPFYQAEILVKNFIPLKYIMNIGNFGLPIPVQPDVLQPKIPYLNLKRPENQEEELSTEVSEEDLADAWVDEYGAKYSKDRRRLLKGPWCDIKCAILPGTKVLCDGAFVGCRFLSSVTLPESLNKIGDNPFAGLKVIINNQSPCFDVYEGNLYDSGRKRLIAFFSGALTFVIPDSVTTIGNYAFVGCSSLSSVVIPDSVTTIGNYAFVGCRFLSSVTLPKSLNKIGSNPFAGLKIMIKSQSPCFDVYEGNLYDFGRKRLIAFSSGASTFIIPTSVTMIGDGAFSLCSSLSSVVIPDSVTTIGEGAFFCCSSLSSVVIPGSVTTIGKNVFKSVKNNGGFEHLKTILIKADTTSEFERVKNLLIESGSELRGVILN